MNKFPDFSMPAYIFSNQALGIFQNVQMPEHIFAMSDSLENYKRLKNKRQKKKKHKKLKITLSIVLAVSLAASLLNRIFSKQYHGGFLGFTDWLLGGVMGAVGGLFYVFVFLAVITPLTSLFMPSLSDALAQSLAESHFAAVLYDNNILLLILRDFFD